jgi:antitoxin MazE
MLHKFGPATHQEASRKRFPRVLSHPDASQIVPPGVHFMWYTMYILLLILRIVVNRQGAKVMKAQMVKWGNSLAVRIPKPIIEEARLKEGDLLEIEAGDGQIELRRATKVPTLAQLVSQITPDNRYPEISTGPEAGKERVEW